MRTPGLGLRRRSSTSGVFPIAWTMSAYLPPQGRLSRRSSTSESVVPAGGQKRRSAARHGRQDHDRVGLGHARVEAFEHANVLVVQVDVHVAVELTVLGEQLG